MGKNTAHFTGGTFFGMTDSQDFRLTTERQSDLKGNKILQILAEAEPHRLSFLHVSADTLEGSSKGISFPTVSSLTILYNTDLLAEHLMTHMLLDVRSIYFPSRHAVNMQWIADHFPGLRELEADILMLAGATIFNKTSQTADPKRYTEQLQLTRLSVQAFIGDPFYLCGSNACPLLAEMPSQLDPDSLETFELRDTYNGRLNDANLEALVKSLEPFPKLKCLSFEHIDDVEQLTRRLFDSEGNCLHPTLSTLRLSTNACLKMNELNLPNNDSALTVEAFQDLHIFSKNILEKQIYISDSDEESG